MTCYIRLARNVTVDKINYDFRCRSFEDVPKKLYYHIFLVQKYKRPSKVVAKNGLRKFLKTRFVHIMPKIHVITMIYGVISKNYVSFCYKVEWAYLFQPCVQKFWKYTDKPHLDFCFWPVFVFWKWGGVRTKKTKNGERRTCPLIIRPFRNLDLNIINSNLIGLHCFRLIFMINAEKSRKSKTSYLEKVRVR